MPQRRRQPEIAPACFAATVPGLEEIAADEIKRDLGAEVKKVALGQVVFRPPAIDRKLLQLRTVEDVFLLLWGTDSLTYRAEDLKRITHWTAQEPDWPRLLQLHHSVRPKPKGKPSYHLVAQMEGEHGYRRVDALKAMAKGMAGKLPASWRPVDVGADVEVWVIIHGNSAVCGLRLSDHSMRHRTYKRKHLPASLRPVVAAAMVRLAKPQKSETMLDPMCGAGTILAERLAIDSYARVLGGDIEHEAVRAAAGNLRALGEVRLARWDARQLAVADHSMGCIACNLPFGKKIGEEEEIRPLYAELLAEFQRVLKPGGRAVLLAADLQALEAAIRPWGWRRQARHRLRILGQGATLSVWDKGREGS